MAKDMVQMTQEQLQQLIDSVRIVAMTEATEAVAKSKTKGSFANCASRFGGQRSYEAVEEFITHIENYKEVEDISDENALKGLPLLFTDSASVWWQGQRKEAKTWLDAIELIRQHFSPAKPPYQIYADIFEKKQDDKTCIDAFILEKRALLAQLPDGRHDEDTEIDMIYGLLATKYRKNLQRREVSTFKDLLEKGRLLEQNEMEVEAARSTTRPKRCTHCNFRGHTFMECRKRKQINAAEAATNETSRVEYLKEPPISLSPKFENPFTTYA